VAAGGTKYVLGTVTNKGTINAADSLYFQFSSQVLDNRGTLNLQGDVGLMNAYASGTFINSGTLIKTSGSGVSSLATIAVTNTGTMDVRSGTLQLPANFTNEGALKGLGTIAAAQIINLGHIAPGASPGTLTLAANLVLDNVGSLDIELHSAALHDLLVVQGNAQLGGTLALSCYALCNLAAGTDIRVLDASGTLSGTFAQVTLQGMAAGAFDVVYDSANSDVYLHVTQNVTAAVPEPQTLALFLGGLAALGWGARRRRAAAAN
jgi:hypothetical protein